MKYHQQRGVALVVTLIMLSVITFLAVAFLALTRRDKTAVNVSLSQTDARFMADTALARAEAELVSRMIAKTNMLDYDLAVSRNFINPTGFISGNVDLLNVNYFIKDSGTTNFSPDDRIINLGNLFYDPRPPVYIKTNVDETKPLDFRFYVDVNRNGIFDTNGLVPVMEEDGTTNAAGLKVLAIGDPEFVGTLEKPQYPHSGTNRFIGRQAYLVVPEGKTLDINFIGNYAKGNIDPTTYPDNMPTNAIGFFRNQGVGSWELNLAAFFQDLNTNMYALSADKYQYFTNTGMHRGDAFVDAQEVLRYRYRTNHAVADLRSAAVTLGLPDNSIFTNDLIDAYADGPLLQTNSFLRFDNDDAVKPWPGSRNPQSFRDITGLLDVFKVSQGMVDRLRGAGTNLSSYDRGTFGRLMAQLGTFSDTNNFYVVEGKTYPKIHLNYDNLTPNTAGFRSQTNFFQWEPVNFFTNVAEALIRKSLIRTNADFHYLGGRVSTNFSITNIMVYPTNEYSPAVHRLLQLSANIYAATTNGFSTNAGSVSLTNLPFVFRPYFRQEGTNLFIAGYREETGTNIGAFLSREEFVKTSQDRDILNTNVYGVPWVISAKKGLPNFNEFTFRVEGHMTRKMELRKPTPESPNPNETNLLYQVGFTNHFSTEFWNSYTQRFTGGIRILLTNSYLAVITNQTADPLNPLVVWKNPSYPNFDDHSSTPVVFTAPWPASANRIELQTNSFLILPLTNQASRFLPSAQYTNATTLTPSFHVLGSNNAAFQRDNSLYVPRLGIAVTNRLFAAIIETNSNRILDLVTFDKLRTETNFLELILGNYNENNPGNTPDRYWATNRTSSSRPTVGMIHQLEVSKDPSREPRWQSTTRDKEAAIFKYFVGESLTPPEGYKPTNRIETPFNPSADIGMTNSWQANDPLVHYLAEDLVVSRTETLAKLNNRYRPWGGKRAPNFGPGATGGEPTDYEIGVKDPMVRWSDEWEFPTNKFPSIGWLGRVHRGTPWQTMYLKADRGLPPNMWASWSGNVDGSTHPTTDWNLLDIFTAAPNDNAARGLLSVNQTNLASWSAVLSGVTVLSNITPQNRLDPLRSPTFEPRVIEPTSAQLSNIVNSINMARTNRPGQVFQSVAEVLSAPALTIGTTNGSPFLNLSDPAQSQHALTDAAVERIPQQILSLLKVGYPRVSVYSFGQALRPAPNSILFNPPIGRPELQNLCTNYQITGEVVTRTVLRVEGTPDNPKAIVESFQILQED